MQIAIVGAGGVGCAAARFLAYEGHEVTLLEQFTPDHDRGSSYGASRIIRRVYSDGFYTALMHAAYPLWAELEREADEPLIVRTGGLFFGPDGHPELDAAEDALRANGVDYERLEPAAVARRFPAVRLAVGESALFQADSGLLRASSCVMASLRLAQRRGACVRENTAVEAIEFAAAGVTLRLSGGESLLVDRAVICAGPWSRRLLAPVVDLPLVVTRQTYCHFAPAADRARFESNRFPVWIDQKTQFYGFPHHPDAPGVKVAWHRQGHPSDPDTVDRGVHDSDRRPLVEYCAHRLPGLSSRVLLEKVCLYTNTPDEDFIVDSLPQDHRVTLVAGLSGHGFKFTVLLGRIAAWMATDHVVPWDLERFRISRFDR